ncbi:helix-turn-helix domain-containing protein [Archangium lipolyticum]|uniref:helix-turn-helix domain-containing protein n=1 Tax=Archangium lipolyticum TaxID=2970465 RepID=UPI00214A1AD6|nr:helix-turn-helix domain-containing protein [Archangium lipolyticum]
MRGAASGPGARLLTVREVAARLSVRTATVYSLCSRGLLRFIRVSGALRIDPSEARKGQGNGKATLTLRIVLR